MRYKGDKEYSKINAAINYEANLKARRGSNFAYQTDELDKQLSDKGYQRYKFEDNSVRAGLRTLSLSKAKEIVEKLRAEGNFARIICGTNKIRMTEYMIYFKLRIKKK